MSATPPPDDASDFELDIDNDLLAAAVAAVEARMGPKPAPSPEQEAAFEADVSVDTNELDESDGDDEFAFGTDDFDLEFEEGDEDDQAVAPTPPHVSTTLSGGDDLQAQLTETMSRLEIVEMELQDSQEALSLENRERRRATAIAVRLKERIERSEAQVATARNARTAAEQRIHDLEEAVETLEADLARLQERRKREVDEAQQRGVGPTIKALLPVLDHLQMAIEHAEADPQKVVDGVSMIVGQFFSALESCGAERVNASAGAPFDPEHHEALQTVASDEHPPGTLVAELRAGFVLNGKLLRAARVAVAEAESGAATHATDASENPEEGQADSTEDETPESS